MHHARRKERFQRWYLFGEKHKRKLSASKITRKELSELRIAKMGRSHADQLEHDGDQANAQPRDTCASCQHLQMTPGYPDLAEEGCGNVPV